MTFCSFFWLAETFLFCHIFTLLFTSSKHGPHRLIAKPLLATKEICAGFACTYCSFEDFLATKCVTESVSKEVLWKCVIVNSTLLEKISAVFMTLCLTVV